MRHLEPPPPPAAATLRWLSVRGPTLAYVAVVSHVGPCWLLWAFVGFH